MVWMLIASNTSRSDTTLICIMLALLIYWISGRKSITNNPKILDKYILFFSVIMIFTPLISNNFFHSVVEVTGSAETFFGRTELWNDCLSLVKNPFLGEGYGNFWTGERLAYLWDLHWWHPNQAHNGYVELYLNLGLLGLSLFAFVVLSSYVKVRESIFSQKEFGRLRYSFFLSILFYNITEATFKGINPMLFLFLLVVLDIKSNSKKNDDYRIVSY